MNAITAGRLFFESGSELSVDWEAENDPRALGMLRDNCLYYDDPHSHYNKLFNSVNIGNSSGNTRLKVSSGSGNASSAPRGDSSREDQLVKRRRSKSVAEDIHAIRRDFEEHIPQMSKEEVHAFQADFARKRMHISEAELAVMLQMSNNGACYLGGEAHRSPAQTCAFRVHVIVLTRHVYDLDHHPFIV
ncbi:hypothetical protein PENSPDRAFT_672210 [Peniophora sp. CONT]|nr:hypothetical protein PENSPDRAFT_672210 [Peniophora sp. CONT]